MQDVKSPEELSTVLAEGTVLVQFSAPWCAPCRAVEPHMVSAEGKLTNVKLVKVDLGQPAHAATASQFNVSSLPTFVLFEGGLEVTRRTGSFRSPEAIVAFASKVDPT